MKRAIAIAVIAAICIALLLAGCSSVEVEENPDVSMFVRVEKGDSWWVVYHRETKVMYTISGGLKNCGNFTLLVNADGTPMLWEGE